VQIRPATESDLDAVFALVEQLGIGERPNRSSFETAFLGTVKEGSGHILLVAEASGVVVGYALTTIARLLYTNGDSAQIQELVVDGAARDRGIGSQLVTAVERECRERGVRQLTVASKRAAAFYERLDYRSTADFLKKSFLAD
jgi:ribosomal protein S18 acetylase RimI-like enzyme